MSQWLVGASEMGSACLQSANPTKAWKPFAAVFLRESQKREKVFAHNAIEKSRLWFATFVGLGHAAARGNPRARA